MQLLHRLRVLLAAGTLTAALAIPASADPMPVKPEDASKHFAAVSKHLDLGGLFFTYMDVDGDLASLASLGDRIIDINRRSTSGIPESLSAAKLIDAMGLTSVKAIGMSSRGAGDGFYHNRALLYMPDGPKGIMKLFGGKASPLKVPAFAPADAGMAMEMELTLGSLIETVESVLKAAGTEGAIAPFKAGLGFPVPGTSLSVGEFIGKLNTRVLLTMSIDEKKKLSVPGAPFQFPGIRIMLALEDVDFVMEPLMAMFGENDSIEVEKGEGFTLIRPADPMPGELDFFSPALYHDQKTRRIILTTHADMAKSAGSVAPLGSTDAFKKASAGLPAEANGLTWVTPAFMKQVIAFYADVTRQSMRSGAAPENMDEIMSTLFSIFPVPAGPTLSVRSNVPEGMLFLSNTNENHKHSLAQAAIVPFTMLAGAIGGYTAIQARARTAEAERPLRGEAPREAGGDDNTRDAAGTVKDNLQQIAFAAHTYFLDHPKATEVTYSDLVKAELIFDLDPVAGESYKDIKLSRDGGELTVELRGGNSVSHKYKAAK